MSHEDDPVPRKHGSEWVSFYDSFDKLVQDQLTRSTELLRQALELPEVAEREARQVRAEMQKQLAAERAGRQELLSQLQRDLAESLERVSMLALGVDIVLQDLERLGRRVDAALGVNAGDGETGGLQGAHPTRPAEAPQSSGQAQRNRIETEPRFAHTERSAPEAQAATPEVDRDQRANWMPSTVQHGPVNAEGTDRCESESLVAHAQLSGRPLIRPHWLASSPGDSSE